MSPEIPNKSKKSDPHDDKATLELIELTRMNGRMLCELARQKRIRHIEEKFYRMVVIIRARIMEVLTDFNFALEERSNAVTDVESEFLLFSTPYK